jgi:hypothetical protein
MPYAKKTLADLKQSLADRHDSGTLPTASATLSFWVRLLNRGVNYCADKLRLEKKKDYTTASGTIVLDDDFLVVNSVFLDDSAYAQVDANDKEQQSGTVYWITGNHVDGFYLNTPTDDTFTVYYSFKPVEMAADVDECIIPDPEAVVAYAYSFLRRSETDPIGDAEQALQECDARLSELQDAKGINENFTGFRTMDSATSKYFWE